MGGDGWQVWTGVQNEARSGDAGLGCSSSLAVIPGSAGPLALVRRGASRDNAEPAVRSQTVETRAGALRDVGLLTPGQGMPGA